MIISASRRTDIPSYYADWFYNRIKEGYVCVRNPMNVHQISRISLSPDVVDGIVFWTKNPRPMMDRLDLLRDYMYYFQFTINSYGQDIEANILSAIECHTTLKKEINDYNKIIFLADKLAWDQGGIPPYYQQLKNAVNISLDKGCYWFISYQFETHQLLLPHTWLLEAYEKLKQTNEGK